MKVTFKLSSVGLCAIFRRTLDGYIPRTNATPYILNSLLMWLKYADQCCDTKSLPNAVGKQGAAKFEHYHAMLVL